MMKRLKNEASTVRRFKLSYVLLGLAAFYLVLICVKFPEFLKNATVLTGDDDDVEDDSGEFTSRFHDNVRKYARVTSGEEGNEGFVHEKPPKLHYGRITAAILKRQNMEWNISVLDRMADEAWSLGAKAWEELDKYEEKGIEMNSILEGKPESCPSWVSSSGEQIAKTDHMMFLPCGLAAGSSITVIGTPHYAHREYVPQLAKTRGGDALVLVSQFMIELQGLKSVVGEDPPKILHLNPRIRGDWSHRPVIEHNTCYRMQWGTAQRCDGLPSKYDDDMVVDGYLRCEKWMRNDIVDTRESKIFSWFDRFIGRAKKPEVTWPFPFVEGRMFILTIRAGIDGYHINVGGRHVTSFPYRTGFTLEDATGLAIRGDVDIHSVYATSLPTSHPSFSPQRVLDFSEKWKSLPLPQNHIQLFIGVLSATNHFAERMAIRKTWMRASAMNSSDIAVRFFVALNPRKELNAILKKEADYFGDIVIVPFIDRYELVVLKTIAICEYGVQNVTAAYIMKCDDDNFVRIDAVLREIQRVPPGRSLYMGNLNLLHRPLRTGKWAVSYEIFKMEDVSMGMWVENYNSSTPVQYSHNWKFCQYGCIEDYFTAHYQSPRQMFCLWNNLLKGKAHCCNF
ncbi:unnamed protein product [Withania somnifera]